MSCKSSSMMEVPLRRVLGLTFVPGFGELLLLSMLDLSLLLVVGGLCR